MEHTKGSNQTQLIQVACIVAILFYDLKSPSVHLSVQPSVVYLFVCISVCLQSICLFVYLSLCLSFFLFICLSGCMCICLSDSLSFCLSVFRFVFLSVSCLFLSICLSFCLSFFCLSVFQYVCLAVCAFLSVGSYVFLSAQPSLHPSIYPVKNDRGEW